MTSPDLARPTQRITFPAAFAAFTVSVAVIASSLAGPPSAAAAATADTEGFFLGFGLHASVVGTNDPPDNAPVGSAFVEEEGGGVALTLAYGLTPRFATRVALSGTSHETTDPDVEVRFSSATLEAQYLFRESQPLRPYLFGGVGGFNLESQQDRFRYETTGPGLVFGAGLLYFLGEHFALDFALRADLINWEESTAETVLPDGGTVQVSKPIEEEGSAAKFLFGAGWWF